MTETPREKAEREIERLRSAAAVLDERGRRTKHASDAREYRAEARRLRGEAHRLAVMWKGNA